MAASISPCDRISSGLANYTGCSLGLSRLSLGGHYFYNLSVAIGGVPCVTSFSAATLFSCNAPVGAGLQPNVAYPVTISTIAGGLSLVSFVGFTSYPSIAYLESCSATLTYSATPTVYSNGNIFCKPGTILTVRGSQFPLGNQPVHLNLLFFPSIIPAFNISCLDTVVVDSSTVTCVLPKITNATVSSFVYGQEMLVQLGFGSSTVWTNTLQVRVYQNPDAPIVSHLSANGCGPVTTSTFFPGNPLQLSNCVGNATLTLTGSYLNGSNYNVRGVAYTATGGWVNAFATVLSNSSTQLVLQLPDLNNAPMPIVIGTLYQYVLTMSRGPYLFSNQHFPCVVCYVSATSQHPLVVLVALVVRSHCRRSSGRGGSSCWLRCAVPVAVALPLIAFVRGESCQWRRHLRLFAQASTVA